MKTIRLRDSNIEEVLDQVLQVIQSGGVVVCPTDTVYGFLVDSHNDSAIEKLISLKKRPRGKPISVFVSDANMMRDYVQATDHQHAMIQSMVPGPYTIILKSTHLASVALESEFGTLGVRIPNYDFVREIPRRLGRAVTATSANLAGRSPVHSVEALQSQLSARRMELIDLIVDAGQLPNNKPSTVLDLTESTIRVLRAGDMSGTPARTYTSKSVEDTQSVATDLLDTIDVRSRPACILITGELGAGKTQFVKGLARSLKIDNIISPTYVIYYEYDVDYHNIARFVHADLYNIEQPEEYEHLGLERYMVPGTLLCMEWGERIMPVYESLRLKCQLITVSIDYSSENERQISVREIM